MHSENWHKLRLIRSTNIGPVGFHRLLRKFGSASEAIEHLPELAQRGGRKLSLISSDAVDKEVEATKKAGAHFLFHGSTKYPTLLSKIDSAPPVLTVAGNIQLFNRPMVAIVGARNASASAVNFARKIASDLGERGMVTVSGLARGIDTQVHIGSLSTGTIAVIAGGIDNIYPPENADLQHEIIKYGCLVSEQPYGTEPRARHFPSRNRIIAGLAQGTLVVEAALKSGSLITARLAAESGREVMAIPGSPMDPRSQGCNQIIREGAILVQNADDMVELLSSFTSGFPSHNLGRNNGNEPTLCEDELIFNWESNYNDETTIFDEEEDNCNEAALNQNVRESINGLLSASFVTVDEIVRQSKQSVSAVQDILLEMELAGRLERGAGGKVRLSF
ncbi:DNA-processing protein DprA [Sphingorhabdus lutea]|nr:DNA-processing protein DprA [Sphingorhabdus lutea]